MRKIVVLTMFVSLLILPAVAQEYPKGEFFAGYQFTHVETDYNASGWNASLTGNINRWFGVTADFSGAYDSGANLHTYMFGPEFAVRMEKMKPFVHGLFGGATGEGTTAFSMALGGGVDAMLTDRIGFRVFQADWLMLRPDGINSTKNVRVSTGILFHF